MSMKSAPLFAALAGSIALAANAFGADAIVRFNRDIRPILAENCFYCHGPDPAARKASSTLAGSPAKGAGGTSSPGFWPTAVA